MIQDIPDDDWMLRDDIQWAFEAVSGLGLRFEALGMPRHIDNFLTVFKRYPDMKVVIDHCMKPQIAEHSRQVSKAGPTAWRAWRIKRSAFCKFSALITEAGSDWSVEDLRPYVDHVIGAFGADRVMWGSDWPVCRLAGEYMEWRDAALELTADLSDSDRAAIYGQTASRFYDLGL